MHKLKVLGVAVSLLAATPALAQEMGGATGPGRARGLEPTYNDRHYNGCDQQGEISPGGGRVGVRTVRGENSYAMSPDDGTGAQRYRSYDPASGTYMGYDGRHHSCE